MQIWLPPWVVVSAPLVSTMGDINYDWELGLLQQPSVTTLIPATILGVVYYIRLIQTGICKIFLVEYALICLTENN